MAFDLDRIDGTPALSQVRSENVSVRGEEAVLELRLSADLDIELYFPAPGGAVGAEWLGMAGDVMIHLTAMDNVVQRVSAQQWATSPYPTSYYEGELVGITLARPDEAMLHYSVLGCNSEWDERFVRASGRWVRVAVPDNDPNCFEASSPIC